MTRPVHLVPTPVLEAVDVGDTVVLDGAEGRHAVVVRRLRVGEVIDLVDGAGVRATVRISRLVDPSALEAEVLAIVTEPVPAPRIVVVQALAKGDRGETAVETLTEVGVDAIVPWQAARCVVQWTGGKGASGLARWSRIAVESGKQSRRARFPEVGAVASTDEVSALIRSAAVALVLDETADLALTQVSFPSGGDVVLVVGPEGGFTEEESAAFVAAGAVPVRLGPTVLRTSTAGTVAAAVILSATSRWQVQ